MLRYRSDQESYGISRQRGDIYLVLGVRILNKDKSNSATFNLLYERSEYKTLYWGVTSIQYSTKEH